MTCKMTMRFITKKKKSNTIWRLKNIQLLYFCTIDWTKLMVQFSDWDHGFGESQFLYQNLCFLLHSSFFCCRMWHLLWRDVVNLKFERWQEALEFISKALK